MNVISVREKFARCVTFQRSVCAEHVVTGAGTNVAADGFEVGEGSGRVWWSDGGAPHATANEGEMLAALLSFVFVCESGC
jgi:hypothetical protein